MKPEDLTKEEMDALLFQEDAEKKTEEQAETHSPSFPNLAQSEPPKSIASSLDLLADVELDVTVQLGQTRKNIRDILNLGPGSVVELDRQAGEAVDILVNGHLVAKGEVVVIGENFGVRLTSLVRSGGGLVK